MSNPYILIGILVALIASYFYGVRTGANSERVRQGKIEDVIRRTGEVAQQAAAKEIAAIDVRQITIRSKVQEKIVEIPVYRECRTDADTLRLLDAARANSPVPESAGSSVLP